MSTTNRTAPQYRRYRPIIRKYPLDVLLAHADHVSKGQASATCTPCRKYGANRIPEGER